MFDADATRAEKGCRMGLRLRPAAQKEQMPLSSARLFQLAFVLVLLKGNTWLCGTLRT